MQIRNRSIDIHWLEIHGVAQNWSRAAADFLSTRIAAVLRARCLVRRRTSRGSARDAAAAAPQPDSRGRGQNCGMSRCCGHRHPLRGCARLQARRSNNSPRGSHSRSIEGSVVEALQRNLSRRRFQILSHNLGKWARHREKLSERHLLRKICNMTPVGRMSASVKGLWRRKISITGSLSKTSARCTRSLYKISRNDLLARSL